MVLWRPTIISRINTKKGFIFIIWDWDAKVRSQETPGASEKFGLGVKNGGKRLTEFCQEKAPVIGNTLSNNTRADYILTSPDGQ